MSKIDYTRPIRQIDGDAARFMGEVNTGDEWRFVVAINLDGLELVFQFDDQGYSKPDEVPGYYKLENIPEPEEVLWYNVYKTKDGKACLGHVTHPTCDDARRSDVEGVAIARLRIAFRRGQFDEEPTK